MASATGLGYESTHCWELLLEFSPPIVRYARDTNWVEVDSSIRGGPNFVLRSQLQSSSE